MAEDVENPRKKQKLESLSIEAKSPTLSTNPSDGLASQAHSEGTNVQDKTLPSTSVPDGEGDKAKPDDVRTSNMDKPSGSKMDIWKGIDATDSDSSALSPLSGEDMWKAEAEPTSWVYRMMADGDDPREVLEKIMPGGVPDLDTMALWRLLMTIVSEPPPRDKLPDVNTLNDVLRLIRTCKNIIVLTGAGVSVSCGIPDFRSRNGVYARLAVDFPNLPDPQAMFDIDYFKRDQRPFFKFAKEIYPGQFKPSICHRFIRLLEEQGQLLRNYTQNIDTLEQVAGIKNVIQCHGSFATATCMVCKHKCSSDDIKDKINQQIIPRCPKCDPPTSWSVMKPDIVFFGESLPDEFHRQMAADKGKCDLLIVIGSSLKVRPVAFIPNSLPARVPQILINKEHLKALNFDVELLGDCDIIIGELSRHLGDKMETIANKDNPLREIRVDELLTPPQTPVNLRDRIQAPVDGKTGNADGDKSKNPEADKKNESSGESKDNNSGMKTSEVGKNENGKSSVNLESDKTEDLKTKNVNENNSVNSEKNIDNKVETEIKPGSSSDAGSTDKTKEPTEGNPNESDNISEVGEKKELNDSKPGTENKPESDKEKDSSKDQESSAMKKTEPDLRSMWMPAKWLVSKRLASNQYCYMPPNRYVFNDAEVFMIIDSSDSNHGDSSDDSDSDFYKSDSPEIITIDDSDDELNDGNDERNKMDENGKDLGEKPDKDTNKSTKETSEPNKTDDNGKGLDENSSKDSNETGKEISSKGDESNADDNAKTGKEDGGVVKPSEVNKSSENQTVQSSR